MWLRGARGDGARLVGGGVDQDPAQEPGEFVTEGVGAIFPHSAHNRHPLPPRRPLQCAYRPADAARREDGGRDDGRVVGITRAGGRCAQRCVRRARGWRGRLRGRVRRSVELDLVYIMIYRIKDLPIVNSFIGSLTTHSTH